MIEDKFGMINGCYPEETALLMVIAHPDDEAYFPGLLTYYAAVRKLPVVLACMTQTPWLPGRKDEMRNALLAYGVVLPPIFMDFPDCCYGQAIDCCLRQWNGLETAVEALTYVFRKLKPHVVVTHDLKGEYGHPNHIATAIATTLAFRNCPDSLKYPGQIMECGIWNPVKCYVNRYDNCRLNYRMSRSYDELNGETLIQVHNKGIICHKSQDPWFFLIHSEDAPQFSGGLYASSVGDDDPRVNDLLQHTNLNWNNKRRV